MISVACRDLGFACEWAVHGRSAPAVIERVREHLACAHALSSFDAEWQRRVDAASRPA